MIWNFEFGNAGIPADDRFRPLDPSLGVGNPNVQSTIHEVTEESSSTSSQLKEEAIHIATMEADIDESCHNVELGDSISGKEGEIQRVDEQTGLASFTSQEKEATKLIHNQTQSQGNRKESGIGNSYPVNDSHTQQIGEAMGVQIETRQEGEMGESQ